MGKNTNKHKAIKKLVNVNPPSKIPLPFNGEIVKENGFSFSFSAFDRTHELFNLSKNSKGDVMDGRWFLELLDCLKSVSGKNVDELKKSKHELHPIDWSKTNAKSPSEQGEYWQFRIDKSSGRVIGLLIDSVFYVVWLDPHHNLTNSEGYGGVKLFPPPK